jgi:deoxyribodipyrimidine photo-lyase
MSAGLVWFRRDLRSFDHAALYHALRHCERVHCAFVFDTEIIDALPSRADRRVAFIHASLVELDAALDAMARRAGAPGSGLIVRHGSARDCIPRLAAELGASTVFANRDYEPFATARDSDVARRLEAIGVRFVDFKDQVVFDRDELLTQAGGHFKVFTPYWNAWRKKLDDFFFRPYPVERYAMRLAPKPADERIPSLADIGFAPSGSGGPGLPAGMRGGRRLFDDFRGRIDDYRINRDFPALDGVSHLSAHLRFGTVSIRELAGLAWRRGGEGAQTWLSEIAWRDFYQMILWRNPHVVDAAFRPEYERVPWLDAPAHFAAWSEERTGYPIVDAAMRQLHRAGYMHNRLRMVVASFLTKDLQIDWRHGEQHFAEHLLDYDLAANNGGWQWAASTGCDAQPWFRIFNPVAQSRKFDPEGKFIRRWLPELARMPDAFIHAPWTMDAATQAQCGVRIGVDYPAPIVDHAIAREQTLARFQRVSAGGRRAG